MTPLFEYQFTRRRISEQPLKGNNALDIWMATSHIFQGAETERLVVVAKDSDIEMTLSLWKKTGVWHG